MKFRAQPDMDLAHCTNGTALHQFHDTAVVIARVNLRAHLRDQPLFSGYFGHHPGLEYAVGQGFFTVTVLAKLHGQHTGRGVHVVRCANDHGIDLVLHLMEHYTKVSIAFGLGEFPKGLGRTALINITQGHNILTGHPVDIGCTPPAHTDPGDVQLFIGWGTAHRLAVCQDNKTRTRTGQVTQEITAIELIWHQSLLLIRISK